MTRAGRGKPIAEIAEERRYAEKLQGSAGDLRPAGWLERRHDHKLDRNHAKLVIAPSLDPPRAKRGPSLAAFPPRVSAPSRTLRWAFLCVLGALSGPTKTAKP